MKQIEATILGQTYVLACPNDGEQQLQQAVAIVDREMSAIRDAGRVKARERIAVLTALNLAYQRVEQAQQPAAAALPPATAAGPASLVDADLTRLIQRIDQALNDDGHLL